MRRAARQRGFTMIELLIVIVIILVVTAMAIPSVLTAMYNFRLRSSGSEVAGLLQQARMQAIRDNRTYPLVCSPQPLTSCTTIYVDLTGTGTGAYGCVVVTPPTCTNEAAVQLPGTVRFSNAAPPIAQATLGFAPLVNQQPYFNSRGLPCNMGAGGVCASSGYVFYFQDTRPLGASGYSAVAITPMGRIRVYSFDAAGGWSQA